MIFLWYIKGCVRGDRIPNVDDRRAPNICVANERIAYDWSKRISDCPGKCSYAHPEERDVVSLWFDLDYCSVNSSDCLMNKK